MRVEDVSIPVKEFHTSVIIAILPRDAHEDEHCTIVYAGKTDQLVSAPVTTMAEVCNRVSKLVLPFPAWVTGWEWFGPANQTHVATIDAPQIHTIRACTELFHNSEFGIKPHISAVGSNNPRPIGVPVWFDRIALWYGEHRQEWRLGQSSPLYSMR